MNEVHSRQHTNQHWLWLVLVIYVLKILSSGLFSSGYLDNLFLPFLNYYVKTGSNPWTHFYVYQPEVTFPYPPLMLYLLTPFAWILQLLQIQSNYLIHLVMKLPLAVADAVIFYFLYRLRPQSIQVLTLVYVLSPIIIFSAYFQGQLDLIPTAFLLAAVYDLTKAKLKRAAITTAAALLCKSTALVALPFLLIFIYRKSSLKITGAYLLGVLGLYFIGSLPYLWQGPYLAMVINNPQQHFIFNTWINIGNLRLYPLIVFMIAILGQFMLYKKINTDLLLSYLTLAFSMLLIFAYPVASWFVWVVPYLALFMAVPCQEQKEFVLIYFAFSIMYMAFFLCFYRYPLNEQIANLTFLKQPVFEPGAICISVRNIAFTLLASMLSVQVYLNYRYSIRSNSVYRRKHHFTLIGISGDSGSGKSILLDDAFAILGKSKVTYLEGDGEHRWERGDVNWQKYTHLDPKANLLHQQIEKLCQLKQGLKIDRRDYDHDLGKFTDAKTMAANDYIIIAGLHTFYLPKARKSIDIKIYVDTDEKLRWHWKMLRDMTHRGYSKQQVIASLEKRQKDREKYILPQKQFSDICFRYFTDDDFVCGDALAAPEIKLQVIISANIDLEKFYVLLRSIKTLQFNYDYSQNLYHQEIIFSGQISAEDVAYIASEVVENLDELLHVEAEWQADLRGVRQLIILVVVSYFLKETAHETI